MVVSPLFQIRRILVTTYVYYMIYYYYLLLLFITYVYYDLLLLFVKKSQSSFTQYLTTRKEILKLGDWCNNKTGKIVKYLGNVKWKQEKLPA